MLVVFVHMFVVDLFSLVWPLTLCYALYCMFYISLRLHSLILYYQSVDISFKCSVFISHSLFLSSFLSPFILWGEAECVLEGSIPRQPHHRLSSSYLFPPSPFLLLQLSHPTFIVSDWMSASIYPRLHSTGSSLIFRLWHRACSCGSLLLSNQPFFRYTIILMASFISWLWGLC